MLLAFVLYCTLLLSKGSDGIPTWLVRVDYYHTFLNTKKRLNFYQADAACKRYVNKRQAKERKSAAVHSCCLCVCKYQTDPNADSHRFCYTPCAHSMDADSKVLWPITPADKEACIKACEKK